MLYVMDEQSIFLLHIRCSCNRDHHNISFLQDSIQNHLKIDEECQTSSSYRSSIEAMGLRRLNIFRNKRLKLITWICRSSFKTNNSFYWFFSENRETESCSNVRKLLIFSPIYIILSSLIMIIMMSLWPVS